MKKKFFLFVVVFFSFLTYNFSQTEIDWGKFDQYLQNGVEKFKQPGLAIAVVKGNEVVFQKGYGVRDVNTGVQVDEYSLFGIASLSKAFTAVSIGILVDEGKLDWDDRVIDHLPWFQLYDPYVTREIRVKDLLCHRSGLATFDGDLLWYGTDYTREEIVKRIRYMKPKNGFRDKYGYQNIMFITAGELIEEVSGISYDEFVRTRIFIPLGMNNSLTTNQNFDASTNVAIPHIDRRPQPFIDYDNAGAAAIINSCTDDLCKWMMFWINRGKWNDTELLSNRSYRTITSAFTSLNVSDPYEIDGTHFRAAALGWFLYDYSGRKIMTHGGGLSGYISRITVVPEDSLGVIVLTNDMSWLPTAVSNKVLDMYMNDKDVDYIADTYERYISYMENKADRKKRRSETRIEGTSPSQPLSSYVGVYEDKMYGEATVELKDDHLFLTMLPTKEIFYGQLNHWHYDTFDVQLADEYLPPGLVTFHFGSNGKIEKFTIDLPNPDFHFYNLEFIKQD